MQHTTEDLSPVKKKITVTVPAEEVDAALSATIAMYRTSVSLDGFRKGKVPASIIEKRFRTEIYKEATTDLVNVHINQIISESDFTPVSRIDFDGGELERGKEFTYSISFDVMPAFEVPNYEGMDVEQEEALVNDDELNAVVDRLRSNMAEVITVGEDRPAKSGDIAVIDFEAFDESGAPIQGIKASNFNLPLGEGQTLPDFETLVESMKVGESKEGPVSFPEDFFNTEFAGKTVTMKATLHALKERKLPELDDAFAQKAGGFENVEKLRESIRDSYVKTREDLNVANAQTELLEKLLKMVEFPVPESMLQNNIDLMLEDMQQKMERQGKSLASLGKTLDQLREEVKPEAEMRSRTHILLMTVAKKNGIEVSEQEVDLQLRRIAIQHSQNYETIRDYYTKHNLMFALRDRIMSDKAMKEIYSKVKVTMVPPKEADAKKEAGKKSTKKAAQKKTDEE